MNHIVLFEPEIPQNAGNIMRTCVATNSKLHLIEPLGFSMRDRFIKRSAVNHLANLDVTVYEDWEAFLHKNPNGVFVLLTRYGTKAPHQIDVSDCEKEYFFIFGRESNGVPSEIHDDPRMTRIRLPMHPAMRSLNLANTVAIVVYEALRQQDFPNLSFLEPKRD